MSVANDNSDKTVDSIQGERSMPSVNTAKRSQNNVMAIFFVVLCLIVLGGYAYFSFFSGAQNEDEDAKEIYVDTGRDINLGSFVEEIEVPEPDPPKPEPEVVKKPVKVVEAPKPVVKLPPPVIIDHSSSGLMVSQKTKPKAALTEEEKAAKKATQGDDDSNLGEKLVATKTEKVGAVQIKNRNLVLTKGTVINCSLQTKIDSSLPGFVSCVTTRDIYSDTGSVLLIERGSQVVGEYQGTVENGVSRLFVLWTRVKTTNGIVVDINSPATDPLGAAGAEGHVESRFWTRFGAAMLLSVLDEAYSTATDLAKISLSTRDERKNRKDLYSTQRIEEDLMLNMYMNKKQLELAQQWEAAGMDPKDMPAFERTNQRDYQNDSDKDRPRYDIGSGTSPFREIISAVLGRQANIPEIMTKNQGEKISIFVARDLDFSEVYDVKPD